MNDPYLSVGIAHCEAVICAAEHEEPFEAQQPVAVAEHQPPAYDVERDRRDREHDEVLGDDVHGVLRPRESRLHESEPEVHEEHQHPCEEYPQGVQCHLHVHALPSFRSPHDRPAYLARACHASTVEAVCFSGVTRR
jgi:hypothetical protein